MLAIQYCGAPRGKSLFCILYSVFCNRFIAMADFIKRLQAAVGDTYRLEEEQVAEAILDGDAL